MFGSLLSQNEIAGWTMATILTLGVALAFLPFRIIYLLLKK